MIKKPVVIFSAIAALLLGCMETTVSDAAPVTRADSMQQKIAAFQAMPMEARVIAFGELANNNADQMLKSRCGNVMGDVGNIAGQSWSTTIRRYEAHLPRVPSIQECYARNADSVLDERFEDLAVLRGIYPTVLPWYQAFDVAGMQGRSDNRSMAQWGAYSSPRSYESGATFTVNFESTLLQRSLQTAAGAEISIQNSIQRARGHRADETQAWLNAFNEGFQRAQASGALSFDNAISGGSAPSQRTADNIIGLSGSAAAALDAMDRIRYGNKSANEAQLRSQIARAQSLMLAVESDDAEHEIATEVGGANGQETPASPPVPDEPTGPVRDCNGNEYASEEARKAAWAAKREEARREGYSLTCDALS